MEDNKRFVCMHREDYDEIIGKMPSETLMRCNLAFAIILITILWLSIFIPYKDLVKAPIQLSTKCNNIHICEAFIKSSDYGKITIGQKVIITLDIYPRNEFGTLEGHVTQLDDKLVNGNYRIQFEFDSLQMSYGQTACLLSDMQGMAEIVTSEQPILYKIFPFTKMIGIYLHNKNS